MLILDSGLVLRRAHLIQTITLDATRVDNFFHDVQRLQWTSSLVLAAGPNTLADGVKSSKRLERLELGNCYFHSLPEQPPVGGWTVHRDIGMGQTYGWWRGWWGWWVHSHISQLGPKPGTPCSTPHGAPARCHQCPPGLDLPGFAVEVMSSHDLCEAPKIGGLKW